MPWQGLNRKAVGRVKIHVFLKAVGIEKIVAHPARGKIRRCCGSNSSLTPSPEPKTANLSSEALSRVLTSAVARIVPRGARIRPVRSAACRNTRVARGLQTNFLRVAEKFQRRGGQRNFVDAEIFRFGASDRSHGVPINLQVGDDADAARGGGNLAAKIRDHGPFQAGGNPISSTTRTITLRVLRFHVRRNDLNVR